MFYFIIIKAILLIIIVVIIVVVIVVAIIVVMFKRDQLLPRLSRCDWFNSVSSSGDGAAATSDDGSGVCWLATYNKLSKREAAETYI